MPILLLHGWPGSFVQMLDLAPLLADPAAHGGDPADAFDVVVASLPGYGYSDRPKVPGMTEARMAGLMHGLMTEVLGYRRYAVRGSDFGGTVATHLAKRFPHIGDWNPCRGHFPAVDETLPDLSPDERRYAADARRWRSTEVGQAGITGRLVPRS